MNENAAPTRLPFVEVAVGPEMPFPLEAAKKIVSPMFDLDTPRAQAPDGYMMDLSAYDLGPMQMSVCKASASVMRRSSALIALTGTDHFIIQFYQSTGFDVTIDGHRVPVPPLTVAMFDLRRTLTIETDQIDNVAMIIPRDLLAPMVADINSIHGLVLRTDSEANVALIMHMKGLWERLSDMGSAQAVEETQSIVAMIAAIIGAHADQRTMARRHMRKNQFIAICRWIDEHLGNSKLQPSDIVAKFFITRPTLYRMFEQRGGIMRYILERRLERVMRDLVDPQFRNEKISAVMQSNGLQDHTSAGRAFRSHFGVTPRQVRQDGASLTWYPERGGTEAFRINRIEQLGPLLKEHNVRMSHFGVEKSP